MHCKCLNISSLYASPTVALILMPADSFVFPTSGVVIKGDVTIEASGPGVSVLAAGTYTSGVHKLGAGQAVLA